MIRNYMPDVPCGILLSYYGEVHRDTGHRDTGVLLTRCGEAAKADRVAPCTAVQAIVFQLGLCSICYPDRNHPRSGSRVGR